MQKNESRRKSRRKAEHKERDRSRKKNQMINKESQRGKTEVIKKGSRRQTKKETGGEGESRGYAKKDRGERQKVEDSKSRTQENKETEKNQI